MVTFHLTFVDSEAVCRMAEAYRSAVQPFAIFDSVPDRWLHMTLQDVAFLDEVSARHVDDVIDGASDALAQLKPFDITFLTAQVGTEGVFLPLADSPKLTSLRHSLRAAVTHAGITPPGEAESFWPHVSVAYCHASAPSQPVTEALGRTPGDPATVTISHVDLIALSRDAHVYEWLPVAEIPL